MHYNYLQNYGLLFIFAFSKNSLFFEKLVKVVYFGIVCVAQSRYIETKIPVNGYVVFWRRSKMKTGKLSFLVAKFVCLLYVVVVMGMVAAPAFAEINWTNANANNDFNDLGNWSPAPGSLNGQDCYINGLSDANKAEISYTLSGNPDDLYVGVEDANTGELLISGGNNTITNRLRVGRLNGTGIVTITDGTLNVLNTYSTFGDTGTAVFTMSGGTLNIDRVTFGQKAGDSSTLNMSAGTININTSDATPASTSGSLRMGLGNANLNISSTAVITAEKLYIAEGGLINMSGGTVSITGAEDAQPTFNFTEAAIGDMAGEILFNGGHLLITGDYESLFYAAIGAGNIYTTMAAQAVHAEYFAGEGLTKLVLVSSEKAYHPNPAVGKKDVPRDAILEWMAGDYADTHDVYFGMVFDDVNDASRDNDPNGVLVSQNQAETTYDPPGLLEFGQSYYWRIDEFNDLHPNSPWKGNVSSFTVSNYFIVDDFESYNDLDLDQEGSRRIYLIWIDGFDSPAVNGSTMGYPEPSFADGEHFVETDIVHSGFQSAPISYDNTVASYSEVKVSIDDLSVGRDWAAGAYERLSLWIYGDKSNSATEQMYLKLNDTKATFDGDLTQSEWLEWSIDPTVFNQEFGNVGSLSIGFDRTGTVGSTGLVFIDDIRLYRPTP